VRPSLRFLAIAVVAWAGLRAATIGTIPGARMFSDSASASASAAAPVPATQFAEIEPIGPAPAAPPPFQAASAPYYYYPPGYDHPGFGRTGTTAPLVVPVYYSYRNAPAPRPAPAQAIWPLPEPGQMFYPAAAPLDDWPLARNASAATAARSTVTAPMQSTAPVITAARIDRIQLTMWAMLRNRQGVIASPTALASGGTLGGSQAGARLFYHVTPAISAVIRSSSDVGRRGGEVAGGVRVRPLRAIPLWITAERRQALGKYGGGRNAFALFAEGGVYGRPMPFGFTLDGYVQGGVVGFKSRDLFADGGLAFTRPVYRQFSAGFGMWGGVQPGLYRVDAGPRVTMQVRRNVRVHFDYRQRLAGNAEPGSGPTVTLAGDF
jgi:hypothetical protein